MKAMNVRLLCVLLTASLAGACGGGSNVKAQTDAPISFPGFPPTSWKGMDGVDASVYAEARFVLNHSKVLGTDLTKEGVLPVRLTLGLRGKDQDSAPIRLDPDQVDMRLYLPNGTVLTPISAAKAAKLAGSRRDKVRRLAMEAGMLPKYEDARDAPLFVFFGLPKKYHIDGNFLTLESGKYGQVVNVSKGLLTFNVMFENKLQPFYVGVGN